MNKNAYQNLKIRVCGEEQVLLTNTEVQTYLIGFARGTPGDLSDSERYFSLDHATMMAFFKTEPVDDPCIINFLERRFEPAQLIARASLD
jgi:hypothetical protein